MTKKCPVAGPARLAPVLAMLAIACGPTDEDPALQPGAPVAQLRSPHSATVSIHTPDGAERIVSRDQVLQEEPRLFAEDRIITDATGEVVVSFFDRGQCSVWHGSKIAIPKDLKGLVEIVSANQELICHVTRELDVTTLLGRLTLRGTTFGIRLGDDGLGVRIYDGAGEFRPVGGADSIPLKAGEALSVATDGTASEVTGFDYSHLDSVRIQTIAGSIDPAVPAEVRTVDKSLADLVSGDCLAEVSEGEIQTVEVVACSGPHQGRVVVVVEMESSATDPYPGLSAFDQVADQRCPDETTWILTPLESSWESGLRRIACIASGLALPLAEASAQDE